MAELTIKKRIILYFEDMIKFGNLGGAFKKKKDFKAKENVTKSQRKFKKLSNQ